MSDSTPSSENHLQKQAALAQSILEMAVDGIISVDFRGRIESFNPAAERIFGWTAEDVLGKNVDLLMPPPYRDEHDDYIKNYLTTGIPKIIGVGREVVGLRKDGSTFPMDLAVCELVHEGKRLFTGIVRDISKRKTAERNLRRERDFTRAVLDTTAGLVVVLDPEGTIVRFNRACESLTGYTEEEVRGRKVWELIPDEDLASVQMTFQDLRALKSPNHHENSWLTRDQKRRLISWSNSTMVNDAGAVEYIIATGSDVTEQRRAEHQTAQQEKLAAVGQLASGIAHEIGNPLASISAVTQTLIRKTDDPFVTEKLQLVGRHIERISNIVRKVMDFARPSRIEWKLASINEIISDAVAIVRFDKRAKRAQIDLNLSPDLPSSYVVPDLLSQVVINVVLNGLDALETLPNDAPRELSISTCRIQGDGIRVIVDDSGPGVPPNITGRILEPFFTTKEVGKGTGLGLAVSYRIIREHEGEIRVENRPGGGARFVLEIPLLDEAPAWSQRP